MSEHNCTISRAGIRGDGTAILDLKADDPNVFGSNWFLSAPEIGREVLAVALTAMTTGKHLECVFADPIGPFTRVESVILLS
jgi:hypothetical protein